MDTLTRTGNVVYDQNRVVVAEWVHGAWYKRKDRSRRGTELVPIDDKAEISRYASLPDSMQTDITDGDDLLIVGEAKRCLEGQSSRTRNKVASAIEDGVKYGIGKYGPFDAQNEVRDLHATLRTKIRNAMVFCAMNMVLSRGQPVFGEYRNTFIVLANVWMRLGDM